MKNEFRYALRRTTPVFCGYLFLGMAFGVMLENAGYGILWALFASITIFSGSMQYALVGLLTGGTGIITAAIMTIAINGRYLFYGLSFIEKFLSMGKMCPYMIFSLTDETYSLLCEEKPQDNMNEKRVFFLIASLDHVYWIFGSVLGAFLGSALPFDAKGIDFAMTALFLVIFTDQWLATKDHKPAIIGIVCSLVTLFILGPDKFIIPAMLFGIALLILTDKKRSEKGVKVNG